MDNQMICQEIQGTIAIYRIILEGYIEQNSRTNNAVNPNYEFLNNMILDRASNDFNEIMNHLDNMNTSNINDQNISDLKNTINELLDLVGNMEHGNINTIRHRIRDNLNNIEIMINHICPPLTGGKKIRKHKGIYQTGKNAGKLKPGYKYSNKKTKTGLRIIIKTK